MFTASVFPVELIYMPRRKTAMRQFLGKPLKPGSWQQRKKNGKSSMHLYMRKLSRRIYCLKGLFDSCVSYFHVGNWKVHKAALIMEFSASQLLEEDVSYYTVYLNGEPLITEHLARTQGKTGQIILELPEDRLLTDSVNSIMVDVYLRGRDTDACVDDSSVSILDEYLPGIADRDRV